MNNWWEDLDMSEELKEFHEEAANEMGIPSWAVIDCPYCNEPLSQRSIRGISLRFNARNIGDVAVEFCCDECSKMDTVYFRKAARDMEEFAWLVNPNGPESFKPESEPIIEEKMYSLQYNNLVEKKLFPKEN
jgi:hypothetical protein